VCSTYDWLFMCTPSSLRILDATGGTAGGRADLTLPPGPTQPQLSGGECVAEDPVHLWAEMKCYLSLLWAFLLCCVLFLNLSFLASILFSRFNILTDFHGMLFSPSFWRHTHLERGHHYMTILKGLNWCVDMCNRPGLPADACRLSEGPSWAD